MTTIRTGFSVLAKAGDRGAALALHRAAGGPVSPDRAPGPAHAFTVGEKYRCCAQVGH
ncbi:MAG: hypothetical protein ACRECV_13790 [Xanthobacteraceae bacterium]